jgi:hypothetical protein
MGTFKTVGNCTKHDIRGNAIRAIERKGKEQGREKVGLIFYKMISPKQGVIQKNKGPRTKAPFTSHHPLPPKRSFNEKLIDTRQMARYIGNL